MPTLTDLDIAQNQAPAASERDQEDAPSKYGTWIFSRGLVSNFPKKWMKMHQWPEILIKAIYRREKASAHWKANGNKNEKNDVIVCIMIISVK